MLEVETIVFDLDGTLYEDRRVYDRYAQELARFLPSEKRESYLRAWEQARRGRGVATVGMGYDARRDLLFRFHRDRITEYVDWEGQTHPPPPDIAEHADPERATTAPGSPMEVPIFGPDRLNIGDFWVLPDALAAHYGVPREQRSRAFSATRAYMASDAFDLRLEPGQEELLEVLRAAGKRLIAMSNAGAWTVADVVEQLGIGPYFSTVVADAGKPLGLSRLLEQLADPGRVLSVGDNFVNDLEPALKAGTPGLYIDRHGTKQGADFPTCHRVCSIQEAQQWLMRLVV